MSIAYFSICFFAPFLGSYVGYKLVEVFGPKLDNYPKYTQKEYKDPFDPENLATWNFSQRRLYMMQNEND
jgi:hypothetical protein